MFNVTATVQELNTGTYVSLHDSYSHTTYSAFVENADEALKLWEDVHVLFNELNARIFNNYDVFLAGQRIGRGE